MVTISKNINFLFYRDSMIYLGVFNYEQTKLLFKDLLNVFNKILLPTHDSSHVQFLLFHICSFHTVSGMSCSFYS